MKTSANDREKSSGSVPTGTEWLQYLAHGAVLADGQANLIAANAYAKAALGLPAGRVRERPLAQVFSLLNRRTREDLAIPLASFLTRAKPTRHYHKAILRAEKGRETLVNATFSAWRDPTQPAPGLLLVFEDVGEYDAREHIERNRKEMEMVGAMAKNIAEDFGPWLQTISACAGNLAENLLPNTHVSEQILKILAAAENANDTVKRLTGLTEAASPERTPVVESMALGDVVGNAITLRQNMRPHSRTTFNLRDVQLMALPVRVDSAQLLDSLFRMFEEIERGTVAGARIVLGVARERVKLKSRIVLRINDRTPQGGSLREETLTDIRAGMEAWGGEIRLAKWGPDGVALRLFLPLAVEEESAAADLSRLVPRKATVLLAEDHEEVRRELNETLTRAGYEVLCARNGTECHKLHERYRKKIGLVALDALMPGKNARHLVRTMLARDPTVSIMIMSGFSRDYVRGQIDQGQWGFIQKPVDTQDFLERVEQMLERKERRQRISQKNLFKA
jgi:CheY-like chemotaxis protein